MTTMMCVPTSKCTVITLEAITCSYRTRLLQSACFDISCPGKFKQLSLSPYVKSISKAETATAHSYEIASSPQSQRLHDHYLPAMVGRRPGNAWLIMSGFRVTYSSLGASGNYARLNEDQRRSLSTDAVRKRKCGNSVQLRPHQQARIHQHLSTIKKVFGLSLKEQQFGTLSSRKLYAGTTTELFEERLLAYQRAFPDAALLHHWVTAAPRIFRREPHGFVQTMMFLSKLLDKPAADCYKDIQLCMLATYSLSNLQNKVIQLARVLGVSEEMSAILIKRCPSLLQRRPESLEQRLLELQLLLEIDRSRIQRIAQNVSNRLLQLPAETLKRKSKLLQLLLKQPEDSISKMIISQPTIIRRRVEPIGAKHQLLQRLSRCSIRWAQEFDKTPPGRLAYYLLRSPMVYARMVYAAQNAEMQQLPLITILCAPNSRWYQLVGRHRWDLWWEAHEHQFMKEFAAIKQPEVELPYSGTAPCAA